MYVFIEPFNLSFFSITGRGIDLDYCDIEWFALEMNRNHSVEINQGRFSLNPPNKFLARSRLGDEMSRMGNEEFD